MSEKFYQVLHRGHAVGFFKEKKYAEIYAAQFMTEIEGYAYPVDIRELYFLDEDIKEEIKEGTK